jgi:hypothetical protein
MAFPGLPADLETNNRSLSEGPASRSRLMKLPVRDRIKPAGEPQRVLARI